MKKWISLVLAVVGSAVLSATIAAMLVQQRAEHTHRELEATFEQQLQSQARKFNETVSILQDERIKDIQAFQRFAGDLHRKLDFAIE